MGASIATHVSGEDIPTPYEADGEIGEDAFLIAKRCGGFQTILSYIARKFLKLTPLDISADPA